MQVKRKAVYFQNLGFVEFQNVCVQYFYEQCTQEPFSNMWQYWPWSTREEGRIKLTSESEVQVVSEVLGLVLVWRLCEWWPLFGREYKTK